MVGPVLVTVEPARTPKLAAVRNATGAWLQAAVVKVQGKSFASGCPVVSLAPVVIFAEYAVPIASGLAGVNVAVVPVAAYVTVPGIDVAPCTKVNVVGVIVAGS